MNSFINNFYLIFFMRIEFEKKSISPVIATVLLLSVAIISVISFSNWFASFQSNIMSEVEISSKTNNELTIDTFTGNNLYLSGNNEIKKISINGVICSENLSVSGNVKVDLSNCLLNLKQGKYNVVLETNNGVKKRSIFLKNEIKEISLETVTKSISGLVGYWNFNDGTAKDLSGNGNDGTLIGDVKIENGKAIFDGSFSNYIKILDPLKQDNLEQEWTVNAIVNIDKEEDQFLLSSFNNGLYLHYHNTGNMILYLNSGINDYYTYGYKNLQNNQTYFVSFVFNNKNGLKDIYLNGERLLKNGPNAKSLPLGINSVLQIGKGVLGSLDEISIYNRSLSYLEIQSLYNSELLKIRSKVLFDINFLNSENKNLLTCGVNCYVENDYLRVDKHLYFYVNDFFNVSPGCYYELSGNFTSLNLENKSRVYYGFAPYDVNKNFIYREYVNYLKDTETEVYEDFSKDYTMIKIKNSTNWEVTKYNNIAFNVDDSGDYLDLPNHNTTISNVDIISILDKGNYSEVYFNNPVGISAKSGTKIREHRAEGGTYLYSVLSANFLPINSWNTYSGRISYSKKKLDQYYTSNSFGIGAKYARIVIIVNYDQGNSASFGVGNIKLIENCLI